jgi:hypothetical protein
LSLFPLSIVLRILLPFSSKSNFNLTISFLSASNEPELSSFIQALFLIILALYANFKVEMVSPKLWDAEETAAIKHVFELPPSESFKIKVNLESL